MAHILTAQKQTNSVTPLTRQPGGYTLNECARQQGLGLALLFVIKMALKAYKIPPQLDDKNRARLESRSYERAYTDVPNKALPETYRAGLSAIFTSLSGEPFDLEASTFTVRADDTGTFKGLYSPSVFSTEEGGLVVRWGDQDIPLVTAPGKIGTAAAVKGTKFGFKEEAIGKYTETCLNVSVPVDGILYTLPIPIRRKDIKEPLASDLLEMLLDENPSAIPELVQVASDLSKRGQSSGERLNGPFIKVANMPLGDYTITSYRKKEGGQYGVDYYLQAKIDEPFEAPVRTEVDGEWVNVDTMIVDWAIVRPNTALKKILAAEPLINSEHPAVLKVTDHFEFNGNPAAKATLKCTAFAEDPDSFNLSF